MSQELTDAECPICRGTEVDPRDEYGLRVCWACFGSGKFTPELIREGVEGMQNLIADRLERPGVVGRMFGQSSNEWFIGIDMDARDIVAALGCPLENDMPVKVSITPAAT